MTRTRAPATPATVPGANRRTAPDNLAGVPQSKSKRSRYTPPPPKKAPSSPLWVPTAMFTLLVLGTTVVIVNYLGLFPDGAQNRYLILGLVEICAGFVFATRYR